MHGKSIVHLTNGNDALHFFYDAQGRVAMVEFNGVPYYYVHNLQGDVIALVDNTGVAVVEYSYDAWGKPICKTGALAGTLGTVQPFRYRGYVWDEETQLYYLRSRYYRSKWDRFINADTIFAGSLFIYCYNNPLSFKDHDGNHAYQGESNCYAYALRLQVDPRTGMPFTQNPSPGAFSGHAKVDLTRHYWLEPPDIMTEIIYELVLEDARNLNLEIEMVPNMDYEVNENQWLIALAFDYHTADWDYWSLWPHMYDYHWYRMDYDRRWSHQDGTKGDVKYVDTDNRIILDPQRCNGGRYNKFGAYFLVRKKRTQVKHYKSASACFHEVAME